MTELAFSNKKRLIEFDFLKVVAIILIVLSHFAFLNLYSYSIGNFFGNVENIFMGTLGVIGNGIFFFVSGYTLFLFNHTFSIKQDYISFFRKRVLRIYPMYWVGIFVFIGLNYVLHFYDHFYSSIDVIIHLTGMQILFFPKYIHEISGFWFVSAILLFYIIYCFLISISSNSREIIFYGLMVFFALMAIRVFSGMIEGRFFEYFFVFFIGAVCSKENSFNNPIIKKFGKFLIIPILLCFSIIILLKPKMTDNYQMISVNLLVNTGFIVFLRLFLIFICAFYIYYLVSTSSWKENIRIQKFFENCSLSAFPIYLFHIPFFVSVNYCLITLLGITGFLHDLIIIVAGWPLLFILSYNIQYYFQKLTNFSNFGLGKKHN